MEASTDLND